MAATSPANPVPEKSTLAGSQHGDRVFSAILVASSLVAIFVLGLLAFVLIQDSGPSLNQFGFSFLTGTDWDPAAKEVFGAATYIFGTIITSAIALLLATPLAIGAALYVTEYAPRTLGIVVAFTVELLVTIPSVVYGLWGLKVLAPFLATNVEPFLQNTFGNIPLVGQLFQGPTTGRDIFAAGVILAIMILPTILSITREIITQVPRLQKEGMLALGATKWETIRYAILPFAKGGIAGAAMLGFARAVGETMAVTMIIGNVTGNISATLFAPSATIASVIANQAGDTAGPMHYSAILELGLILMVLASVFNIAARLFVKRITQLPMAK